MHTEQFLHTRGEVDSDLTRLDLQMNSITRMATCCTNPIYEPSLVDLAHSEVGCDSWAHAEEHEASDSKVEVVAQFWFSNLLTASVHLHRSRRAQAEDRRRKSDMDPLAEDCEELFAEELFATAKARAQASIALRNLRRVYSSSMYV